MSIDPAHVLGEVAEALALLGEDAHAALEGIHDERARDSVRLLVAEIRVTARRALNLSRYCAHPANRGAS